MTYPRFSTDARVTDSGLDPQAYGDVYFERASAMLGSVVRLPLRETVMGCVLMGSWEGGSRHVALLILDSVTGQWMMSGIATRMALDLGLHHVSSRPRVSLRIAEIWQKDPDTTDLETSRQNRLCFWSVLILDYTVASGVGRPTTLDPNSITQSYPSDADIRQAAPVLPSPFPHIARIMHSFGTLINLLNSESALDQESWRARVELERIAITQTYHALPHQMRWTPEK